MCPRIVRSCWSRGRISAIAFAITCLVAISTSASAAEHIYFPAVDNVTDVLVEKIRNETVRVDLSCWYLTEHAISIALINKYNQGVPVRLLGDRGSIFEIDPRTKTDARDRIDPSRSAGAGSSTRRSWRSCAEKDA